MLILPFTWGCHVIFLVGKALCCWIMQNIFFVTEWIFLFGHIILIVYIVVIAIAALTSLAITSSLLASLSLVVLIEIVVLWWRTFIIIFLILITSRVDNLPDFIYSSWRINLVLLVAQALLPHWKRLFPFIQSSLGLRIDVRLVSLNLILACHDTVVRHSTRWVESLLAWATIDSLAQHALVTIWQHHILLNGAHVTGSLIEVDRFLGLHVFFFQSIDVIIVDSSTRIVSVQTHLLRLLRYVIDVHMLIVW